MPAVPPKLLERIVEFLLPPACREEVLGDMHERFTSSGQYIWDAIWVVPMVIGSRIRRTADPQVVLMEALVLYLSYLGAAWYRSQPFLYEELGLVRLAIPAAMFLQGILLDDAYAAPGEPSPLKTLRGPVVGLGFACFAQAMLASGFAALALPIWIMLYGSAICLLLASAMRILFPPLTERPLGVSVPAFWLKHDGDTPGIMSAAIVAIKGFGLILVVAFLGAQIGGPWLMKPMILLSALVLIMRELSRKG